MVKVNQTHVIDLYNQSPRLTYQQIAVELAIPVTAVHRVVRQSQLQGLLPRKNLGAPLDLTKNQIDKLQLIAELRKNGLRWHEIGNRLGMSRQAAHNFTRRNLPELLTIHQETLIAQLITLYNETTLSVNAIASTLQISYKKVKQMIGTLRQQGRLNERRPHQLNMQDRYSGTGSHS